jgi:hypothetical protein
MELGRRKASAHCTSCKGWKERRALVRPEGRAHCCRQEWAQTWYRGKVPTQSQTEPSVRSKIRELTLEGPPFCCPP